MITASATNERSSLAATETARERLVAGLPVTERRFVAAGIATAVLEGGDGPPIVLLPGPGESALWWMRVIPELVATHRVVAPDLPGQGASGAVEGPLDADRVVAWLDELIERTCPEPPTLVGHVLGGAIAARFAAARGGRLERLVLVDSLGLGRFRPAPLFALRMVRFLMRPNERTQNRFLTQCMYDADRLRTEMGDRWAPFQADSLAGAREPSARAAMRELMRKVGVPVIPPETLARIEVPTTLIWGRHDRANRLRIAEAASARYGWPLLVIESAADDPKLERPAAFLDALHSAIDAA